MTKPNIQLSLDLATQIAETKTAIKVLNVVSTWKQNGQCNPAVNELQEHLEWLEHQMAVWMANFQFTG